MKALITGANSLINQTILKTLADTGYEVVAHYHTDNEIAHDLKLDYPNAKFLQADFSIKESFEDFLNSAELHGPYDVIINGAVYYAEALDSSPQLDWKAWSDTMAVNLITPGLIIANATKLLNHESGVIINISSANGIKNFAHTQFAMYSASKSALDSLTVSGAKNLAPKHRVVGIAPGLVKSAWNSDFTTEQIKDTANIHLTKKLVEPQEIADLVMIVIQNPSITGTTIVIDGGLSAPIWE